MLYCSNSVLLIWKCSISDAGMLIYQFTTSHFLFQIIAESVGEKMSRNVLVTFSIFLCYISCCAAYEVVNSTQNKIEYNSGLKNYEEEEDGKVLPYRYHNYKIGGCVRWYQPQTSSSYFWFEPTFFWIGTIHRECNIAKLKDKCLCFRTFLTTVEIVCICVFTVLFVILLTLLIIYVCMYGWVLPACCR